MDILFAVFTFIFGICVGSFINVVIDRLPEGRPLLVSRSVCDSCGKMLRSYDLIPLMSYIVLQGRCRFCKKKIPIRLFFVELLVGFLFVGLFYLYTIGTLSVNEYIYSLIVATIFIPIFLIDIKKGLIMDELLVLLGIVILSYLLFFNITLLVNHIFTGIGLFMVFFLLFYLTSGRGMGFGDVKLSFILGFYLGFPNVLVGVYLAFLTGAVISIILVLWGKKKLHGGSIPFGPFLVSSAFVAYIFGQQIIEQVLLYFNI